MSRPIELCLAALRFHPAYAGPSVRFKRYASGFRKREVHMRVFSAAWGNGNGVAKDDIGSGVLLPKEVVDGIPVQRVRVSPRSRKSMTVTYARALASYCQANGRRPDIIQYLDLSPWSVPWMRKLRHLGVPLVYTRTMIRDPSVGWIKNIPWKIPYRFLNCVVVSTGVMKRAMREAGIRTRIEVIPNGLDLQRFRPIESSITRRDLKQKLDLDPDGESIVFVGGFLNYRKGTDVLAAAWAMVAAQRPKAQLVFVGPHYKDVKPTGPQEQFLDQIRASLESSGAPDRVVFTGAIDNVEEYLQVADVFVFPSRREGMPNVVPEAFGCGAPSILTPFIGLPEEFGRPGREYVLAQRTPEVLAGTIVDLLNNPALRKDMAARARKWVEQELDVEVSLDRYAELYRELVKEQGCIKDR